MRVHRAVLVRAGLRADGVHGLDGGGGVGPKSLAAALERWRDLPGAVYPDGTVIEEPWELIETRTLLRVCDRFKCLPDEAERQDARVLRLLRIEQLGTPPEDLEGGEPGWST